MDFLLKVASEEAASQNVHMSEGESASSSISSSSSFTTQPFARHDHEGRDEEHSPEGNDNNTNNNDFQIPIPPVVARANEAGATWQNMYQQLKDFHQLGHRKIPPRLAQWMDVQRRQYKIYGVGIKTPTGIITHRIRQLNSIGFDWTAEPTVNNNNRNHHAAHSHHHPAPQVKYPGSPIHPRVILPPSHRNGRATRGGRGGRAAGRKGHQRRGGHHHHHDDTQHMLNAVYSRGYARGQPYSNEEDRLILRLQQQIGNKWSKIAKSLNNGRTDKDISNRFVSLCRRLEDNDDMMEEDEKSSDESSLLSSDDDDEEDDEDDEETPIRSPGHVQSMVRAALAKERTGGRVSRSVAQEIQAVKTSSRTRKPSRRIKESYNPLGRGGDDGSSVSEGSSIDHDNTFDYDNPTITSRTTSRKLFPEMLFQLVTECSASQPHILDWIPDGTAFLVKEPDLMPAVIQRYFRHDSLASLTRSTYVYGFKKILAGPYTGAFSHPHFTKYSTRESVIMNVRKVGGDSGSLSSSKGGKQPPVSKSKRAKHGKPGGHHSSFNQYYPIELEHVEPTANDTLLTLTDPNYKEILFAEFKKLGRKTKDEDVEVCRQVANEVFQFFVKKMQSNGGRFMKHTKGGGSMWYEEVDDDWAFKKIRTDFQRRMNSSRQWLTRESTGGRISAVKEEVFSSVPLTVEANDVVVSLRNPKYKRVMFAQYKKLGKKQHGEGTKDLAGTGEEIFNMFKKGMGKNGHFWRQMRYQNKSGEDLYELLDEEEALERITGDLRRRMESASHWLNVPMEEIEKSINEEIKAKMIPTTATIKSKPKSSAPKNPTRSKNPPVWRLQGFQGNDLALTAEQIAAIPGTNYNLGKIKDFTNVQYFKSDIAKDWIEQKVPRFTIHEGKKDADIYFLSPEGLRFRSMLQAERHLAADADDDLGEEDDVEVVEEASIAASEEEMDNNGPIYNKSESTSVAMADGITASTPFVEALYALVTYVDANDPSVISWATDGEAFYVHDKSQEKLSPYLLRYNLGKNYNGLASRLDGYGFTKPPAYSGAWCNPDFHRDFNPSYEYYPASSTTSRKRLAPQADVAESSPPRKKQATSQTFGNVLEPFSVTYTCDKCYEDKTYTCKKTAVASFTNHHRQCNGPKPVKKKKVKVKKESSPGKVKQLKRANSSSSQKDSIPKEKPKASGKPVTFNCPHCLKNFTYSYPPTAAASFSHHTRACDPNKKNLPPSPKKKKDIPKKKKKDSPKKSLSPQKVSIKTEKSAPSSPPAAKSKPPSVDSPNKVNVKATDDDIVLSLMYPKYKTIMLAKFKELGPRKGSEENPMLDELKHEMLSFFKEQVSDKEGRIMKADRNLKSVWVVDDDEALQKIKMDLKRRHESEKQWLTKE